MKFCAFKTLLRHVREAKQHVCKFDAAFGKKLVICIQISKFAIWSFDFAPCIQINIIICYISIKVI